ncbi:golgin candidate 6-like [Camellia sinensis]|uniref:golgin candidate 6-like n=1 Tax=Camellia sinensis TaxID=4442 RepID=UPI001036597E|nr:golgin candidate 6-like [Camellia sinensis]
MSFMLKLLHEIKRMIINNHLLIYQQKETSWCITNFKKVLSLYKKFLGLLTSIEAFYLYQALRCIGDLIANHTKNLDALASKVLREEPQVEPALNSILRIILRTCNMLEFVAADYVFKCFCEKNPDGQAMLASTLIPQPQPMTHAPPEEDVNMSFGSILLHGLTLSQNDGDLKVVCIVHILPF